MSRAPARLAAAFTMLSAAAFGQCANAWAVNVSLPSLGLIYDSALWDADGPGPLAPRLVVGGPFQGAGPGVGGRVMLFDDTTGLWQSIGVWPTEQVGAVAAGAAGELFASGALTAPPYTGRVKQWNGVAWVQLGGAFDRPVMAAAILANGDLIVGGDFTTAGAVPVASVARWDGSAWQSMGNGLASYVDELLVMPNGDVVAGGLFGVARWDGVTWNQLGPSPGWCLALAVLPGGDLVAGLAHNQVVRWNSTTWTWLGGPVLPIPTAYIEALVVLPNGDLVAAEGTLIMGGTLPRLARWNGAAWTPIGTTDGAVRTMTVRPGPNFDVAVAGSFANVNGLATNHVARLTTPCPAAVTTIASGCVGGGVTLAAEPAWSGAVWQATASGLPQPAFVIGVYGFSPGATPLRSVIPQAVAGCTLHERADILQFLPNANGVARASWPMPNGTALAGAQFRHQMIAIQFGAGLAILSAVASDAASMTVGVF